MNTHKPKRGPKAYTKRWFSMRRRTIGASEAAAVCGMSRWSQPLTVYHRKTKGESRDEPMTEAQEMGHILEPSILSGYHKKAKGTMQAPVPMLIHPSIPFMVATPDALWTDMIVSKREVMDHNYIPVDAKTSRHSADWGDEGTDAIPNEYIFQAQQQMAVTGAQRCDLPVLMSSLSIKVYKVGRNESLISQIISAERELIERLENKEPPEANWSHPGALDLMKEVYEVKEESVQLDDLAADLWDDIAEWKSSRSELDRKISSHKARLLGMIKDAAKGELPDGRTIKRKKIFRESVEVPAYSYVRMSCTKTPKEEQE